MSLSGWFVAYLIVMEAISIVVAARLKGYDADTRAGIVLGRTMLLICLVLLWNEVR